jgi:hypothetical protein
MNEVLKDIIGLICEVYLDDIIIYSRTMKERLDHVIIVIHKLNQHNLKIKFSLCKIAKQEITYLSHTIRNGTIKPNKDELKDLL